MGFLAKGVENDPGASARLGGYEGGSANDQNALEDEMRRRYGYLGQATPIPGLAPWLTGQDDTTRGWVDQSRGSQQDAYRIANAMGLGGQTPQQQQLAQSYGMQNAGIQGAALAAGGGARGAAAAQGNAYGAIGTNVAQQSAGMDAQRQGDMMQGQQLAAQAANALRAGDQGALANRNYGAVNAAQFSQGMSENDMQRGLYGAGMSQKALLTRLGLSNAATDAAMANARSQRAIDQQMIGTGLQAAGTLGAGAASYMKKNP